jgi:hypothetical protein
MNMPGFTAELSLYNSGARYRMKAGKLGETEANIFPQLRIVATYSGSDANKKAICAQVGDLVDETYQQSVDPSNDAEEQSAWHDLAKEMYGRAKTDMGCSFGVVQ